MASFFKNKNEKKGAFKYFKLFFLFNPHFMSLIKRRRREVPSKMSKTIRKKVKLERGVNLRYLKLFNVVLYGKRDNNPQAHGGCAPPQKPLFFFSSDTKHILEFLSQFQISAKTFVFTRS